MTRRRDHRRGAATGRSGHVTLVAMRWGLSLAALVGSLAVAELSLRLFSPESPFARPPASDTIDPYATNPYIVTHRPGLQQFIPGSTYRAERPSYVVDYEINARGLRGPEIGPKTDSRLVVLGDSIPEGHGVAFEETFVSELDRTLDAGGWSVVSAAMQGGSPLHYAANLPRTLGLDPDAVLLVLYENDLWDDRTNESKYFGLPLRDVETGSRLWGLARRSFMPRTEGPLEKRIRTNRDTELPPTKPDPISPIVVGAEQFQLQWNMSQAYLDVLADELEEREVPLLVAVFALGTLVPRMPEAHGLHALALERHARAWSARRNLPFLSLFEVTEAALRELPWERVLIPNDGHPTAEMHHRLAVTLEPWLRTNLH